MVEKLIVDERSPIKQVTGRDSTRGQSRFDPNPGGEGERSQIEERGARNDRVERTLEVTTRWPRIRTAMNWHLSMLELYLRAPEATAFALFQDDLVCYRNLRKYLDATLYPKFEAGEKVYCNLYLFASNEPMVPVCQKGRPKVGWCDSNQLGRSALGLVFSRAAVIELLSARHLVERACDKHRGWKAVDGGIVDAMKKAHYKEQVHWPSLLQHTGDTSSMGNKKHHPAASFRGESLDAMDLLR
jgi:hypothetical protein